LKLEKNDRRVNCLSDKDFTGLTPGGRRLPSPPSFDGVLVPDYTFVNPVLSIL